MRLPPGGGPLVELRCIQFGGANHVGWLAPDPHHPNEVAVAVDGCIHCYDVTTGERTRTVEGAVPPGSLVRCLSWNTNKPWFIASAGDDCKVKIWDLRRPTSPVKILDGHTHW